MIVRNSEIYNDSQKFTIVRNLRYQKFTMIVRKSEIYDDNQRFTIIRNLRRKSEIYDAR